MRRRRRIVPRGRRKRRGPKPYQKKLSSLPDRRTTAQLKSVGLSTGRNSSSRREMTGKVRMRRLDLLRAKNNSHSMGKGVHPQYPLRTLQRLPCTRMTDLVDESRTASKFFSVRPSVSGEDRIISRRLFFCENSSSCGSLHFLQHLFFGGTLEVVIPSAILATRS